MKCTQYTCDHCGKQITDRTRTVLRIESHERPNDEADLDFYAPLPWIMEIDLHATCAGLLLEQIPGHPERGTQEQSREEC